MQCSMKRLHLPPPAALALLALVYTLNFLDRTLIYILFAPIKAELSFTDLQLALLGSTSFVLFYTTLGVPFGRLADRGSRRWLIAGGLFTWSVFSAATAWADSFATLFFCRVMVGVGEATLGPAAMSLLSDLYPASKRGTVQSIYSAGVPLGAAAAFFLGSHLAAELGWRAAFVWLGLPGVALAVVVAFTLPEPARAPAAGAPTASTSLGALLADRAFVRLLGGYALVAVAAQSMGIWVPSLLTRGRGIELTTMGNLGGFAMLVGGGLATLGAGALADRWERTRAGGRRRFGATVALLAAPLWVVLLSSTSLPVLAVTYTLLAGLGLAWLGPAAADVHELAGPHRRGVATAVYYLVVNLAGYGLAPPVVGWISDRLGGGPEHLGTALVVAPLCCVAAAAVLWQRPSPDPAPVRRVATA